LLLLIFNQYLKPDLDLFVNIYCDKYDTYQIGAELGTGIGVIYSVLVFAFVLYYSRFQVKKNVLLFKIAVISYYVIPIGFVLVMIARIGMYLQPALIAVIPIVAISLRRGKERMVFLFVYLLYSLYQFYGFFQSDVWRDGFGKYNVIFFAPQVY
ncbi:MAG: hypothetical protein HGB26_04090, partial [Desulfobulbaceae bacterium]|nr:hypothetical protein [Desulfobulbaceae bacterium]